MTRIMGLHFGQNSLKTRVTIFTFVIFTLLLWTLSFSASRMLRKDFEASLSEQQFDHVTFMASMVDQELEDRLRALELAAEQLGQLSSTAAWQKYLTQATVLSELFSSGTYVTDLKGLVLAEHPSGRGRVGLDLREREHVRVPLEQGKAVVGTPVHSKVDGVPLFAIGVPLHDRAGKLIGALVGSIDLTMAPFLDRITHSHYGDAGNYYLIACKERLIIAATEANRIMQTLAPPGQSPGLDRFLENYEGSQVYVNPFGVEVLASGKRLQMADWGIGATIPTDEAFSPIASTLRRVLLLTVLLTVLAGVLTWWMLKRQLSQVVDTALTLARYAKNDRLPPASLPVTQDDEIGALIAGFNHLLAVLTRNESALRTSEERMHILFETARDVVWTMSLDGRITYVSPVVQAVRGYTAEEAMRQSLEEIHTPASQAISLGYFTQLHADLEAGRQPQNFRGELEYLCKDGSTYWAEVIVRPVLSADGKVLEILGVSRDLSERKRYESQLLETNNELMRHRDHLDELVIERTRELALARDQAESASRAKSAVLSNVSHELRTPLNQIVGNAYLLAQGETDAQRKAQAENVVSAAGTLLRLVDNLIEMARLESAEVQLESVDFSLHSVLDQQMVHHSAALQAKGLEWICEIQEGLTDHWIGDPRRLSEVLDKLVENAIKFSDQGWVSLRCRQVAAKGNQKVLRFEVADQGPGLSASQRRSMFSLFEQGDGSSTRQHGGTGLGLAYARRLVALMGGEIGLESTPGQGSLFWFTLPLEPGKSPESLEVPKKDPEQVLAWAHQLEQRLADDDASSIELWRQAKHPLQVLLGDSMQAFGQALENFEFSDALAILRNKLAS